MKSQQIIAKSCIVFVCMNYPNWNENDYSCFPLSCWRARRAVGRSDGTIFVNWAHKSVYSLGTFVLPPIAQYETCQVDKNDSLNANNELPFLRSTLGSLRSMLLNFPSRDTVK